MKKHILLLLAGAPGTGKSYTGNLLKTKFTDFISLPLDLFKENVYDEIGFDNITQKDQLDEEARQRFYRAIEILMKWEKPIMADYPFSYVQKPYLEEIAKKYAYHVITLRLEAKQDVLYKRQRERDLNEPRHPGHLLNKYHLGDQVAKDVPKEGMPSLSLFKKRMDDRGYATFELGTLIRLNVSDYDKINYKHLLNELKNYIDE